jgi:hypothetical protein
MVPSPANGQGPNGHAALPPPTVRIGAPAPALRLPDLYGASLDLASFRGERTLVLFWNPGCGFCQRMLGDLKAWEAHPPAGAPRLLVVSTGTVEANRAVLPQHQPHQVHARALPSMPAPLAFLRCSIQAMR